MSQRLVTRADGNGRVPAVEVLVSTGRLYDRIIDPEATIEIRDLTGEGAFYGMRTFDRAPMSLVENGLVTEEAAWFASTSPHHFELALRRDAHPELPQVSSPAARRAARSIGCRR